MSEPKIDKQWGAACFRQALIAVILLAILTIICVSSAGVAIASPISPDQRSLLIAGSLLIAIILILVGIAAWGVVTIRRRARQLDASFNPLGLAGRAYLVNGRQYHGNLHARQVDAYFYRGPSLDLYIASPLHTRLAIELKSYLTQVPGHAVSLSELSIGHPALADLTVSSLDGRWGREYLEAPYIQEILLRLTSQQPGIKFRKLLFQPESIQLQIFLAKPDSLTQEILRQWVDDLFSLAEIAESMNPPQVPAAATPLELQARTNRGESALPVGIIACAVLVFFAVIILLIIVGSFFAINGRL